MSGNIVPYRGTRPQIHESAFIAHDAVIVGDVEIGPEANIWCGVVLRGDINHIRVGRRTNIQDGTIVHVDSKTYPTIIGEDVTIGHMALIHACMLDDRCLVGMRATVMDGAVVETGAMVAAGAMVTPGKRVPSGQLWAGSPARYLRDLGDQERGMIDYIAPHYGEVARDYVEAGWDQRQRQAQEQRR